MNDATKMMTPAGIVAIPNSEVAAREGQGQFKCDDQGKPLNAPEKVEKKKAAKVK